MKKQLLSICALLVAGATVAQTPSTDWSINQQAVFPTSPNFTLQGVKFLDAVDANVVWVVGMDWASQTKNYNWYSRSTNGGTSFSGGYIYSLTTNPNVSDTGTYEIANLEGIDANTAWVSSFYTAAQNPFNPGVQGSGAIHRTTNGGVTWVNMTSSGMYTASTSFCNIVSFLTPTVGITQGDPAILGGQLEFEIWRTTNGGLSWSRIPGTSIDDPLSGEYAYVDVYEKLGTSYLWFGTNAGRIYRSTDAGLTWQAATVGGTSDDLLEIAFSSPLQGIAYVSNGTGIDTYNTTNGGASWTNITSSIVGNQGFNDLHNIPGTGKIASFGASQTNSYLSYTSDNGLTWTDWGSVGIPYIYGDFVSNTTGWAGSYGPLVTTQSQTFTNVWKYSGPAISGTTSPLSAFSIPGEVCLASSPVTITPVNSSSATPVATYSWSSNPGGVIFSSSTATVPSITFNTAGTYTIALLVNNGFTTTTSYQVITVLACSLPSVAFSVPSATACNNIAFVTVNQSSGGTPAPSYSWSSSGSVNFIPSPVALNPSITAAPGVYTITLQGSNTQGAALATQVVTVVNCAPQAIFNLPDTLFNCVPPQIKLTPLNGTQPVSGAGSNTYSWTIIPTQGVQPLTGVTAPNYSANLTGTVASYQVILRVTNASGTSSVVHTVKVLWNDFCTAIEENNNFLAGLLVYPNPSTDEVNIQIPGGAKAKISIINVLGSTVFEEQIAHPASEVQISLGSMPRGVYFVTIESKGEKATRKIILE